VRYHHDRVDHWEANRQANMREEGAGLKMTFEQLQTIRTLCLKNAEDLVNSAKNLLGTNVDHICYHLAALALEEIGKAELMQSKFHLDKYRDTEEQYRPDTEDHVKKLFWAIWGMAWLTGKVSKEEIESGRGAAKLIVNLR